MYSGRRIRIEGAEWSRGIDVKVCRAEGIGRVRGGSGEASLRERNLESTPCSFAFPGRKTGMHPLKAAKENRTGAVSLDAAEKMCGENSRINLDSARLLTGLLPPNASGRNENGVAAFRTHLIYAVISLWLQVAKSPIR